ncbi:MAG: hypothetical protein KDA27_19070 [Candidatus Eisenbacteria bacterium]|uniref:Uncharacterized protein n=1 Tax=Eiseniibacteriota bacterium TaxID=2212470 RepID=A0A956NFH0_UNCEI|nr:hypothetical protein [Candidatus Eisenbacteria bacterium]
MTGREQWRRLERLAVVLVALHSYVIGLVLLLFPAWSIEFSGWEPTSTLFFTRQAGILHLVVATGYLAEHSRYGGVFLLVSAKTAATIFLASVPFWDHPSWLVPACAVVDGLMGAVVWMLHRKADRRR